MDKRALPRLLATSGSIKTRRRRKGIGMNYQHRWRAKKKFPTARKIRRAQSRKHPCGASYQLLEQRQVLTAFVSFNFASGELTVDLTDNGDSAIVGIAGGELTVNGSTDVDSATAGTQSVAFEDVFRISVNGDITKTGQSVSLNGDFSNASGAQLMSVDLDAVGEVNFNGDYQLSDRLDIRLVETGKAISDGATGRVRVAGQTDLRAGSNAILLNNSENDFGAGMIATNAGGYVIELTDQTDLSFSALIATGDLIVTSAGIVSNAIGSSIEVAGTAQISAAELNLGSDESDSVNLGSLAANVTGAIQLTEQSDVVLSDIQATSLNVSTSERIFDTRTSSIEVSDTASFNGSTRIRIGENGSDRFNAGSLNFNSNGHVHIWEDSAMNLVGDNTALSLNLYSTGDLTDAQDASLNVQMVTGLEAENITLGDSVNDQFNSGAVYFYTPGDLRLNEDSGLHFTETKNRANRMYLNVAGTLTDAIDARVNIERVAVMTAASVTLGEQESDQFNAGSITFNTTGQFRLHEDSATNIIAFNAAESSEIISEGSITNLYLLDGLGTSVDVATVSSLTGTSIDLGRQTADAFRFGALQFNSPGDVFIAQDNDMVLTGNSTSANATLSTTNQMSDSLDATVNVTGATSLAADAIVLGDSETDQFNTQLLNLTSAGSVTITENSGTVLAGTNRADSLTLRSTGDIIDAPTADSEITGTAFFEGALINLGNEATDRFVAGGLTFRSSANTNITSDSDIEIRGNNTVGDVLLLTAAGNITDLGTARTEVVTRVVFTGVDVIIGDLADDCFDILNGGAASLEVNASGINDVTFGCSE